MEMGIEQLDDGWLAVGIMANGRQSISLPSGRTVSITAEVYSFTWKDIAPELFEDGQLSGNAQAISDHYGIRIDEVPIFGIETQQHNVRFYTDGHNLPLLRYVTDEMHLVVQPSGSLPMFLRRQLIKGPTDK